MKGTSIEERACTLAKYIIETKDTVRGTAKKFGISKSTVHKDVSQRLLNINQALALEVRKVLDENKAERHIRGGLATKLKYSNIDKTGAARAYKSSLSKIPLLFKKSLTRSMSFLSASFIPPPVIIYVFGGSNLIAYILRKDGVPVP